MANWKGIVGKGFTPDKFETYAHMLKFGGWRPRFVVLHNTGVPRFSDWHKVSGPTRMKGLEGYYKGMGWSGGPHLFIADDLIWAFSPLTGPGVHSPSWNSISWGVEMVGDYSVEAFSTLVRDNTVSALATLHSLIGLDSSTLRFHREDPRTTHKGCPGGHVDKTEMITRIHDEIVRRHNGEHTEDRPA